MTADSNGNSAQVRVVAEQVADAAITRFAAEHPEIRRQVPEIPAPLKWAAGIIAALFTAGLGSTAMWLVTSVSQMQVTLARMDEKLQNQQSSQGDKYDELVKRVEVLENFHRKDQK